MLFLSKGTILPHFTVPLEKNNTFTFSHFCCSFSKEQHFCIFVVPFRRNSTSAFLLFLSKGTKRIAFSHFRCSFQRNNIFIFFVVSLKEQHFFACIFLLLFFLLSNNTFFLGVFFCCSLQGTTIFHMHFCCCSLPGTTPFKCCYLTPKVLFLSSVFVVFQRNNTLGVFSRTTIPSSCGIIPSSSQPHFVDFFSWHKVHYFYEDKNYEFY